MPSPDTLSAMYKMQGMESSPNDSGLIALIEAMKSRSKKNWGLDKGKNSGSFDVNNPDPSLMSPLEQLKFSMDASTDPELAMLSQLAPGAGSTGGGGAMTQVQAATRAPMRQRAQSAAQQPAAPMADTSIENTGKAAEAAEVSDLNSLVRAMLSKPSKEDRQQEFLSNLFAGLASGKNPTLIGALGDAVGGAATAQSSRDKERRGENKDALGLLMKMQEMSDNKDYRSGVLANAKDENEIRRMMMKIREGNGGGSSSPVIKQMTALNAMSENIRKVIKDLDDNSMGDPSTKRQRDMYVQKLAQVNDAKFKLMNLAATGSGDMNASAGQPISVNPQDLSNLAQPSAMNQSLGADGGLTYPGIGSDELIE